MNDTSSALFKESIAELRGIVRRQLGSFDVRVYLFGSAATGGFHRTSDLDLAVEPNEPLPSGTLARLRERIEESRIPYRVEIVVLDDVDEAFRERVHREGILWNG